RYRHDLAPDFREQAANIGVAADQQRVAAYLSAAGSDQRLRRLIHGDDLRLLVDDAAETLECRRFAQHETERMDVAAQMIEQPAQVAIGSDDALDPCPIDHLEPGVAVTFPGDARLVEFLELPLVEGGDKIAGAM